MLDIDAVASRSPFRQMVTPGGYTMSVAMTNCGQLGWTTDRRGYVYSLLIHSLVTHGRPFRHRLSNFAGGRRRRRAIRISSRTPA